MRGHSGKIIRLIVAVLIGVGVLSCSEVNKQSAPVLITVTTSQTLQRIDILPGATGCNQNAGTILMQATILNNPQFAQNNTLNDVKITTYRVSYVRTDGGKLIPQPFVRSISTLLTAGGAAQSLATFVVLQPDALNQAPFVALQPNNGGLDPETGRTVVQMDIIVEVFGQTLAGENVSGSTRFPLDFCFNCGGCA